MADFFPKLLDRDFARAQIAEIRELAGPLLGDVIDEGVGVFERRSQTAPGGDANLGVLSFRSDANLQASSQQSIASRPSLAPEHWVFALVEQQGIVEDWWLMRSADLCATGS